MENYKCIRKMGQGSYGEIWLVRSKTDKKQYVLKRIKADVSWEVADDAMPPAANLEARLLATLRHPNIVAYRDSFRADDGYLYIAMNYCEGGDLHSCIRAQRGVPFAESRVTEWFIQICMALQYLHSRKILHRDLKTQNIFLTKSKIVKLGDLGIAKVLDGNSAMATTLIGTPYYMSPELFSGRPYDFKSDVWALGCCIYELVTLRHAFDARDLGSLVRAIVQGKSPAMPRAYSVPLLDLIRDMLSPLPERRPSVAHVLHHPYITETIKALLRSATSTHPNIRDLDLKPGLAANNKRTTDISIQREAATESACRQQIVMTRTPSQETTNALAPENTSGRIAQTAPSPTPMTKTNDILEERNKEVISAHQSEVQDCESLVSSAVDEDIVTSSSPSESSCTKVAPLHQESLTHLEKQRNIRARQRRRQRQIEAANRQNS